MVRTLCAERSRHRFTGRPAICEQYSYCLGTQSWKVLSDISGSRLMMRSPSRSRSNFSPAQGCGLTNPQGRSPSAMIAPVTLSLSAP
jgi:hypothetical protein